MHELNQPEPNQPELSQPELSQPVPNQPELGQIEQADELLASDRPSWVLKHSITCPISSAGHAQFERYRAAHPDEPAGIVIVQHARDVSNHIAKATGVRHESPQVLLVRSGAVLWHASHGQITAEAMTAAMADAVGG